MDKEKIAALKRNIAVPMGDGRTGRIYQRELPQKMGSFHPSPLFVGEWMDEFNEMFSFPEVEVVHQNDHIYLMRNGRPAGWPSGTRETWKRHLKQL